MYISWLKKIMFIVCILIVSSKYMSFKSSHRLDAWLMITSWFHTNILAFTIESWRKKGRTWRKTPAALEIVVMIGPWMLMVAMAILDACTWCTCPFYAAKYTLVGKVCWQMCFEFAKVCVSWYAWDQQILMASVLVGLNAEILKMSEIPIYVVVGVIVAINAVGNMLIIFTYQRESILRIPANTYIVSLACADLVYVILAPLCLLLTYVLDTTQHGNCLWTLTLLMVNFPISIFHLLLIAIDRYTAVTKPLRYFVIMSEMRVTVYLVLAWTLGLVIGLLPQFGWHKSPDTTYTVCSYLFILPVEYFAFVFTTCFAIPLAIMVFLYFVMFREARRQTRRVAQLEIAVLFKNGARHKSRRPKDLKATITVGLILGSFILCFLPTCITYFVYINNTDLGNSLVLLRVTSCCNITLALSTAVNPFIYAYKSQRFRQRTSMIVYRIRYLFLKLFGCQM